jgi:hypothetical protein
MPPGEAPVQEDADLAAADCPNGLGFSGSDRIVVVGLGHVHRVVEDVWLENAQED